MASTNALFTGLAGLNVNSRRMEVLGNNISNVNTTAFKSNRVLFSSAFNRTFSLGTAPTANTGGSNPGQIGLGVQLAGTQRNFANGAISPTGINTDLAIEGEGFFIVERGGEQLYTRAGSLQFNAENDLVTVSGDRLQGYLVDDGFNIVDGTLQPINIPVGVLTIAESTQNVTFNGNLNANGQVGNQGAVHTFPPLTDATAGPGPITGTTLLTDIVLAAPFAANDTITLRNIERGGKSVPDATFTVTATSTVNDYMNFMMDALGIVADGGQSLGETTFDPAGRPGGFTIGPTGVITLTGNIGTLNDLVIDTGDILIADAGGASKLNPFVPTKLASAEGESVRTTFVLYDSLGTELRVDLTMALDGKDDAGTYWRAFLHSEDDTDLRLHMELGTVAPGATSTVPLVSFDNFGALDFPPQINIEVDRDQTGAVDPMQVALRFQTDTDAVSALSDTGGNSTIAATFQDGSPLGVLSSFSVGENGIITGGFTNGLTRTIGRVALASFSNPEGLVDAGDNLFAVGPNSGTAVVTNPLEFGTGRIIGGALELSNVDLSEQFTDMILTTTGYSAASRIITTTDDMLRELLQLVR